MEQEITRKSAEINSVESAEYTPKPISEKKTVLYGLGPLADQMSHQMFQFLVFTYYYAIVGIHVNILTYAFIIFALWDAVNDPLVGILTDRTKSKLGKRRFWTLVSLIPFGLINVFIFTPPYFWTGNTQDLPNALYMILSIIAYDTIYSFFSVSELSLFSEMFITEEERGKANMWKSVLTIIGVIIGFVIPTIIISPLAPTEETPQVVVDKIPGMYVWTGIMVGILVILTGFLFFKYGIDENRHHFDREEEENPGLIEMLHNTFRNGKFILFCFANLIKWVVFKMLTTIIPLWAVHNLGIEGILVSVILLSAFLSSMVVFPFVRKLGLKVGWRNGFIITQLFWAAALIPFWFMDGRPFLSIFFMIFVGVGLSGAIYFVEPIIANIIDEDELRTNKAKAGSYYGINGLINRLSTILVFAIIAIVLNGYGWEEYIVGGDLSIEGLKDGLRLLLVPISIAGNLVVALLLWIFPLHGERLEKVQLELHDARLKRI